MKKKNQQTSQFGLNLISVFFFFLFETVSQLFQSGLKLTPLWKLEITLNSWTCCLHLLTELQACSTAPGCVMLGMNPGLSASYASPQIQVLIFVLMMESQKLHFKKWHHDWNALAPEKTLSSALYGRVTQCPQGHLGLVPSSKWMVKKNLCF